MNRLTIRLLLVVLLASINFPTLASTLQNPPPPKSIAGNWLGTIDVSGIKLRLQLKVAQQPDGKLTAKLDSIDQAANDLPVESITSEAGTVRFSAPNLGIGYEGKLNADSSEITGELKQGGSSFPLVFKRIDKPPTLSRPQDPQKPYPYAEEEVSYVNLKDTVKLAGTLTLPPSKTPVPAVILITGSGSQDRNETVT